MKMKSIKHDLILKKASEMFEVHGFNELKISDLAHEVGVSVGTIYAYFDSKEGLFGACIEAQIEAAYTQLLTLFDEKISFEALIERSLLIKFDSISKKRKTLETSAINNPFFFESQQMFHKEGLEKIHRLYIDAVDANKGVDVDSMQLIYILHSIGNAYVLRWLEGEFDDLNSKAKEASYLFISMMKGYR